MSHSEFPSSLFQPVRQGRVILPILLSALLVVAICAMVLVSIKSRNLEQVGLDKAKTLADQVKTLRSFYTDEVVTRAKKSGMHINYDWNQREGTLPLPATFTNVMGREIEKENPGTRIRLYSRHPFPHRKDTESRDAFEQEALRALEQQPHQPFYRFETLQNRLSIRYAVADVMEEGCVTCHNAHPESPKRDWRVGDVRGVVEIISPVGDVAQDLQTGTIILLTTVTLGLLLVVTVSYFSIKKPIQSVVQVLSETSTQIAVAVEEQERTACLQAEGIHDTTVTMEQLKTASLQVAGQSESAATGARTASSLAEQGSQAIQEVMSGMNQVHQKVELIAHQIQRLDEHSHQIGTIIKLVSDLANQTNLLSLNASIEAVRAGEHGKGFAVVAEEIRKLADQSKVSAEKIQGLIGEIQKHTTSTVQVTDEGADTVHHTRHLAQSAADSFKGVLEAVTRAYESALQISLNVKEQATAIQPIVEAMEVANRGSKETAAGLHETKMGIIAIKNTADRLKAMV
jgi:methyl-accepting chemotaxis protein